MIKFLESISDSEARSLFGSSTSLFGSSSDHYGQCCPPVFDPSTVAALLGGIALATFFLRLVIVTTSFGRRRRRDIHTIKPTFFGGSFYESYAYNIFGKIGKRFLFYLFYSFLG